MLPTAAKKKRKRNKKKGPTSNHKSTIVLPFFIFLSGYKKQPTKCSSGSESASNEGDYSNDEDEGADGYRVGGYHRVKVFLMFI